MISARKEWTFRERVAYDNATKFQGQVQTLKQENGRLKEMIPPAEIISVVELANAAGCLGEEGRQWLQRVKGE